MSKTFNSVLALATAIAALVASAANGQQVPQYPPVNTSQPAVNTPQSVQSSQQATVTTFRCEPWESSYLLKGARSGAERVFIEFTPEGSQEFGDQYTPSARCRAVLERMQNAIQTRSVRPGSLSGLLLTTGKVNGQEVICTLGASESRCSTSNTLLTLRTRNAERSGQVLGQLLKAIYYGGGANIIRETEGRPVVDLGQWEATTIDSEPIQNVGDTPSNEYPPVVSPANNRI